MVKPESPPVEFDQSRHNDFRSKPAGRIRLKIPAESFENVNDATLKHLTLVQMQLLKGAQNIRFADHRNIILF